MMDLQIDLKNMDQNVWWVNTLQIKNRSNYSGKIQLYFLTEAYSFFPTFQSYEVVGWVIEQVFFFFFGLYEWYVL